MRRAALALLLTAVMASHAFAQTAPALRGAWQASTTVASLYWSPVQGASHYLLYKMTNASWAFVGSLSSNFYAESLPAGQAVFYKIQPADANLVAVGPASNPVLISTYSYTDEPIVANSTPVRAIHITQLRTIIDAVRAASGLQSFSWTHPSLTAGSSIVAKEDVADLRSALDAALLNVGLTDPPWTDPVLNSTVIIKREHIEQLRERSRTIPEYQVVSGGVNNAFFSPNGDNQKDTTTYSAGVSFLTGTMRTNFRWILNVRNAGGTAIRSVAGIGTTPAYTWDGRNNSGVVQPEGSYNFELVDADGVNVPLATVPATIDLTAPTAAITAPTDGQTVSNVRQNGSTDVVITGSASDAHFESWKIERVAQDTANIATGTAAVTSATFTTWHSDTALNGPYTLRLTALDAAGNSTIVNVAVTNANFSASQNVYQLNAATGGSVSYTSIIPFPLTETITIKSAAGGNVVRILVNTQRAQGTYTDTWDGRNDTGQLVADGAYQYFATAAETGSMTWDQSAQYTGTTSTQLPYPKCRNSSGGLVPCDDSSINFDPYANMPLRINYCVGGGDPPSCSGSGSIPSLVVAKVAWFPETGTTCTEQECIANEYQASGLHEILWYGMSAGTTYIAGAPNLTIIRRNDLWPKNLTLVYGTAPVVTSLAMSAPIFDPATPTTMTDGLNVTLAVTTVLSRPFVLTARFRNTTSNSVLRLITLPSQPAGQVVLHWNGRADNGEWVAPDLYEILITLTDSAGSITTVRPLVTVRY